MVNSAVVFLTVVVVVVTGVVDVQGVYLSVNQCSCKSVNTSIVCKKNNPILCNSSSACPSGNVCCAIECSGTKCVPQPSETYTAEYAVHDGQCPYINRSIIVPCPMIRLLPQYYCTQDGQCRSNEKCCPTRCFGSQCGPPAVVNPGVCPAVPTGPHSCPLQTDESMKDQCESDDMCGVNQKCCQPECGGKRCTDVPA